MPALDLLHGHFSWVDLATPDPTGSLAFYEPLFGWSHEAVPSSGGGYLMLRREGEAVAGMVALPAQSGIPPCWFSYILVDSVDAAQARALELGASPLAPPNDVPGMGRVCIVRDPTGAHVGLWEDRGFRGAGLFREHGALAWNELVSTDAERARDFYREVAGWEWGATPLPDGGTYHIASVEGRPSAGLMQMTERWPAGMESYWEVYFGVEDVDASHAAALASGARAFVPPTTVEAGRFSVLRDPQGAAFTLFTPSPYTFGP